MTGTIVKGLYPLYYHARDQGQAGEQGMDPSETEQYYATVGFTNRVGFGEQPALLVIACNHGCTDPTMSPIGVAMVEDVLAVL